MADLSLALSGGGAAGFGHIPVLEALDELGVSPVAISGTSAGALIGACYAHGMSGKDIRAFVLSQAEDVLTVARKFWKAASFSFSTGPLSLDAEAAVAAIIPDDLPDRVDALATPMTIAASDFHHHKAVYITDGDLISALAGSMAIPGIFRGVSRDGLVLIDGGVTDNLPLRCLPQADICLAVDVSKPPTPSDQDIPSATAAIVGAMRVMMRALIAESLADCPDAILIEPASHEFSALDFRHAKDILEAAEPSREETLRKLGQALERTGA